MGPVLTGPTTLHTGPDPVLGPGVAGVIGDEPLLPYRDHVTTRAHASPPMIAAEGSLVAVARVPRSRDPRCGPPATTTVKTPCSRPLKASGVVTWRMVVRNTAL